MQQLNTSLILDVIKREGPISRSQIAERTKLSNPAVSAIIASLLEEGLVDEVGVAASTGGRRARLLQFNPSAGFLIGIDVGGTKMYGGAVDLAGNIIARQSIFSKGGESTEDSIQRLMGLIYDLIEKVDLPVQSFKGIGLGIPGVTDSQGQRVRLAPGIGWENVDVGQVLTGEFGVPLFADNDANCFARGELWRASSRSAECNCHDHRYRYRGGLGTKRPCLPRFPSSLR